MLKFLQAGYVFVKRVLNLGDIYKLQRG